jgi:UPF0271 protein
MSTLKSKKSKIYILDTSAILSGKPINLLDGIITTTSKISDEIKPGGKDYKIFQFLLEKGLRINIPTNESINQIKKIIKEYGEEKRLSNIDIDILALGYEYKKETSKKVIILTDDYSIQNIANILNLEFLTINQPGITKNIKWYFRCRGCSRKFKDNISICPICGTDIIDFVGNEKSIKKNNSEKNEL